MLWLCFIILVVAVVIAVNYEKKEPVIISGEKRTTVKPQVIIWLVIAAIVTFCLASCGDHKDTKSQERASPTRTNGPSGN